MTHEGRMARGKENYSKGIFDNIETKYFLENQPKPVEKEVKEIKPKKEKKKKDD